MKRLAGFLAILAQVLGCGKPGAQPDSHGHGHGHGDGPLVHRFEHAEDWAKEFDNPERDAWQKPAAVVSLAGVREGMTVADLGAGTGYFEPHLSRAVGTSGKVLALDLEADMVRYLTERGKKEGWSNVEARQVAMGDPALGEHSVNRLLIVDTWHHIPMRDEYIKKIKLALKPEGCVAIVDFKLDAHRGPPVQHRLAPEAVSAELSAAGLKATIDLSLPEQYLVMGCLGR